VEATRPPASVSEVVGATVVHVPLEGVVDLEAFKAQLEKQLAAKEKAAAGKRGRLANQGYVSKAPPEKVQETRDMLADDEAEIAKLQATIAGLG
jgi:valyl-tRNA synthetase